MSIFFYLGANIHQDALDIIRSSAGAAVLYEAGDARLCMNTLADLESEGRAFSIDRWAVERAGRMHFESSVDVRERVVRAVLGDFRVFLLRTRFLRVDIHGTFAGFGYFSDVVDYALGLAERRKPSTVFCAYTPHTVEAWLIVRTFEELGARVVRLIASPLPWILLPLEGLTNSAGSNLIAKTSKVEGAAVDRYLTMLRGDYSAAKPYYEKVSSRFQVGHLLSSAVKWRPRDLAKFMERRIVHKEFLLAATSSWDDGPFAVYFLHYQPEMNTLPEADLYCDQFQAVRKLSAAMPSGVSLLVKEHPSTFTKRCDRRWRPPGFYQRLAALPNTHVCPAELNTFELIDRAMFVASISGVCLTEALARGKPAVSFFSPRFPKKLVIDANALAVSQLREAFRRIAEGAGAINQSDLRELLNRIMTIGYNGARDDTHIPQSVAQSYDNAKRANSFAIRDLLDGAL